MLYYAFILFFLNDSSSSKAVSQGKIAQTTQQYKPTETNLSSNVNIESPIYQLI